MEDTDSLLIETLVDSQRNLLLGARFYIQGLPFTLLMGKPGDPTSFGIWRPRELQLDRPALLKQRIMLEWEGRCSDQFIRLSRVGIYDGHPPHWKKWERES